MDSLIQRFLDELSDISLCIDLTPVFNGEKECLQSKYCTVFAKDAALMLGLMKELKKERDEIRRLQGELQNVTQEMAHMSKELEGLIVPEYMNSKDGINREIRDDKENKPTQMKKKPTSAKKPISTAKKAPMKKPLPPTLPYITAPEYASVPKYMKGRTLYSEANKAVDVLNNTAVEKYKIVNTTRNSKMSDYARRKITEYLGQERKETEGCFFVTEEDIKELGGAKLDKQFQGLLTILRHCGRLKQIRGGGVTRHVLQQI